MIAREFELSDGSTFIVTWNAPEPEGGDYRCDFSFNIGGRDRRSRAFGTDALQALLLALQNAHVELLSSPEGRRSEITWLGRADLGLPLPNSVSPQDFLRPGANEPNS
jgi:hypothetical protein